MRHAVLAPAENQSTESDLIPTGVTKEDKASSESLRLVLVAFLGGCTFSEISALRFLGREKGKGDQKGDVGPPWDLRDEGQCLEAPPGSGSWVSLAVS